MTGQMEFQTNTFEINGKSEEIRTGFHYSKDYPAIMFPVGLSSKLTAEQSLHFIKSLEIIHAVLNACRAAEELAGQKATIRVLCNNYGQETLTRLKTILHKGADACLTTFDVFDLDNEEPLEPVTSSEDKLFLEISEAICLVDSCLAYLAASTKGTVRQKARSEIKGDYDRLFIKLGREYGFQCLCCKSTTNDLQIDHIVPVSRGGGSEYENLQLLCKSCNLSKGTQTIDYRPVKEVVNVG